MKQLLKYINGVFGVIFFLIFMYCLNELLPFCVQKRYRSILFKNLMAVSCILIICFINIVLCIYISIITNVNELNKILLTFLLLFPMCYIFMDKYFINLQIIQIHAFTKTI